MLYLQIMTRTQSIQVNRDMKKRKERDDKYTNKNTKNKG